MKSSCGACSSWIAVTVVVFVSQICSLSSAIPTDVAVPQERASRLLIRRTSSSSLTPATTMAPSATGNAPAASPLSSIVQPIQMPPPSPRSPERSVTWFMDVFDSQDLFAREADGSPGLRLVYPAHSWVEFGETATDNTLRLEIVKLQDGSGLSEKFIRATELGRTQPGTPLDREPSAADVIRRVFTFDRGSRVTNAEIMATSDGSGLAQTVWYLDLRSRHELSGIEMKAKFYDCNSFALNLLRSPGLFPFPVRTESEAFDLLDSGQAWTRLERGDRPVDLVGLLYEYAPSGAAPRRIVFRPPPDLLLKGLVFAKWDRREIDVLTSTIFVDDIPDDIPALGPSWSLSVPQSPTSVAPVPDISTFAYSDDELPKYMPHLGPFGEDGFSPDSSIAANPWDLDLEMQNETGGEPDYLLSTEEYELLMSVTTDLEVELMETDTVANALCARNPASAGRSSGVVGNCAKRPSRMRKHALIHAQAILRVRVKNRLQKIALVSRKVAERLAHDAAAVVRSRAPALIMVDIIDRHYVSAAFGIARLAVGAGRGARGLGSRAWFLTDDTPSLFDILPGQSATRNAPAQANNASQIIRWAMFGDGDHTGNEKCRTQGAQRCVAVYGPGVLAIVFRWDLFDAVAFLVHFNRGYAMTIPDMAKAFQTVVPPVGNARNQRPPVAIIRCQNLMGNFTACQRPVFELNRALIRFPGVAQNAEEVRLRLSQQTDGRNDCRIMAPISPSMYRKGYNWIIVGVPSSIACGIWQADRHVDTNIPVSLIQPGILPPINMSLGR